MTPTQYCQQKAAASGSSFYYSFMFLPDDKRRAITALYAFCREVDDIVDECSDTGVAQTKLNWWREEISRLYQKQARHPVTLALSEFIDGMQMAEKYFQEIINGMEMDLQQVSYPNFEELSLYCYRVASAVGLLSIEIFGYTAPETREYANDLGMAFQLTNILRDVREDAERGRVYIPADEMREFGVTQDALTQSQTSDAARKLFEHQAKRARTYYKSAFEHLPETDRYAQRTGLIMAAIYEKILDEIESDGYRVLEHRISIPPLRKLWTAWRTSRQEKKHARLAAAG